MVLASEKADQLERDLGVRHPMKALYAGLRARDNYHEVTPFHSAVGRKRIAELEASGLEREDALIVLLMRGARIEAIARAAGEFVEDLAEQVKYRLRCIGQDDLEPLIGVAQRNLNLWRRA
jgi:predicted nucleic acid-binding protein